MITYKGNIIMRLFQWVMATVKDALLLPARILRKAWRAVTSRSSLVRENHELRYQVEALRIYNKNLSESLESVKDENLMLWQHMEEIKEAEKAVMKALSDELQDNLLRTLEPVGDA